MKPFPNQYNTALKGKDHRRFRYAMERFKVMAEKDTLPANKLISKLCETYRDALAHPGSGLSGETPISEYAESTSSNHSYILQRC